MFITSTFISRLHTQQFRINKPTFNRHSNRHFCVNEKKSPKELLSPQIILFFIVGSPVDDPTVLQNRSTMGVQIPSTFPKSLDFKPLQTKVRILPWQMNSTFIIVLFLLDLSENALFCKGFQVFVKYVLSLAA